MKRLIINKIGTYSSGELHYWIQNSPIKNFPDIRIPKGIMPKGEKFLGHLGYIYHLIENEYESPLELKIVYPLDDCPNLEGTGMGSFILSQTFLKIYEDSISSREISPETNILINTCAPELIQILDGRGFQKQDSFYYGYMATIQKAGEKSEEILRERNWL